MEFEKAKEKAIAYLVRSRKTENEVRIKLRKIGCSNEVEDQVIEYIINLGYIDDQEYVDAYIRQCMRLQNYSIYEIKNKLLQKGIKKDIIISKLQELENTDYEKELVIKLLNGKLKNMDVLKQKQYLFRRGFKTGIQMIDEF